MSLGTRQSSAQFLRCSIAGLLTGLLADFFEAARRKVAFWRSRSNSRRGRLISNRSKTIAAANIAMKQVNRTLGSNHSPGAVISQPMTVSRLLAIALCCVACAPAIAAKEAPSEPDSLVTGRPCARATGALRERALRGRDGKCLSNTGHLSAARREPLPNRRRGRGAGGRVVEAGHSALRDEEDTRGPDRLRPGDARRDEGRQAGVPSDPNPMARMNSVTLTLASRSAFPLPHL